MGSLYTRGNTLWVAFKDHSGKRVCKSSGYKVGQEAAAEALLAELVRKAAEQVPAETDEAVRPTPLETTAMTLVPSSATPTALRMAPAALGGLLAAGTEAAAATPRLIARPAAIDAGPTVREYGEQWLTTRTHIETYTDECGRLRNHVFPRIGDMPMRGVRPKHIRELILDLRKSNVHLRGTGQGLGTAKIAPRTVRHIYSLIRRMFSAAVIDEVIEASPVVVAKGVLPKNVDKDPSWRAGAIYDRDELVRLVSDPLVPPDRRILNAIKGLTGIRHGEAAGLRWCNRFAEAKPLGKLVVARSYDKDGTKTQVSRLAPIHPVLAQLLDEWWQTGWEAMYGRAPTPSDYVVPRSISATPPGEDEDGDLWQADQAFKLFTADLEALGMRPRRGHDLRRTFITLAQEDGARRDVLQVITHAPDAADIMSLYTTYPWSTLCAEVAKLQIALPEPRRARAVSSRVEAAPAPPSGQDKAMDPPSSNPPALRALLGLVPDG
jgi:integrase